MKRPWLWTLILGMLVGVIAGFGLALWLIAPPKETKGSPFPEAFAFKETAAKAGAAPWEILSYQPERHERIVDSRLASPRQQTWAVTTQVLARAMMAENDQGEFDRKFEEAIIAALKSHGASTVAASNRGSLKSEGRGHWSWKAIHYTLSSKTGVVYIWMARHEHEEHVILLVSILEES